MLTASMVYISLLVWFPAGAGALHEPEGVADDLAVPLSQRRLAKWAVTAGWPGRVSLPGVCWKNSSSSWRYWFLAWGPKKAPSPSMTRSWTPSSWITGP